MVSPLPEERLLNSCWRQKADVLYKADKKGCTLFYTPVLHQALCLLLYIFRLHQPLYELDHGPDGIRCFLSAGGYYYSHVNLSGQLLLSRLVPTSSHAVSIGIFYRLQVLMAMRQLVTLGTSLAARVNPAGTASRAMQWTS